MFISSTVEWVSSNQIEIQFPLSLAPFLPDSMALLTKFSNVISYIMILTYLPMLFDMHRL